MTTAADTVSHAAVWRLAAPIILSNISVPLVGAVDTAVMGHLDDPRFLGAIALGALVFSFIYWGFGFLRMGTTGFVARDHGRGDRRGIHDTLLRGLLLAALLGLVLVTLRIPLDRLAFALLDGSAAVEAAASEYVRIRMFSAPATLAVYVVTGVLIGLHDTRSVLVLQLVLNLTNVTLDLLFVPVLGFGIAGAALASVIADVSAAALGLYLLRGLLAAFPFERSRILEPGALRLLMRANINIFIRTLCLVFSFAYFTALGAGLGDAVLAANAVLMNFQNIMAYGLDGFAHAVEALGGSAYGARSRARFTGAVVRTTQWAAGASLLAAVTYWTFGEALVGVFSDLPSVRRDALEYLPWVALSPIVSVWSFQLDGIFIGASRTAEMRNAMITATLVYMAMLQWTVPVFGNHGLWLTLLLFMALRALTLAVYLPRIVRTLD